MVGANSVDDMVYRHVMIMPVEYFIYIYPESGHFREHDPGVTAPSFLTLAQHIVQFRIGFIEIVPQDIESAAVELAIKLESLNRFYAVTTAGIDEFMHSSHGIVIGQSGNLNALAAHEFG